MTRTTVLLRAGSSPSVPLRILSQRRGVGPDLWGDLGAQQFDRVQPLALGDVAEVHLEDVPAVSELEMERYEPVGDLIGAPGEDHAPGAGVEIEGSLAPAASSGSADPAGQHSSGPCPGP
jgi:hypothetical protein